MQVKYSYSKVQLDATVKFIGDNNPAFIGRYDYIRDCILRNMEELTEKFPDCYWIGTMGYLISADIICEESIDHDYNSVMFEITVDAAIANSKWSSSNEISKVLTIK